MRLVSPSPVDSALYRPSALRSCCAGQCIAVRSTHIPAAIAANREGSIARLMVFLGLWLGILSLSGRHGDRFTSSAA
jgi:hypothetical protein